MIYADRRCLDHDPAPHPESPARLRVILDALEERGLAIESAPPASRAALTAVHDPDYLDEVRAFCEAGGGRWDADTRAVPETYEVARVSAGLAVRAVTTADGPRFALGRPPGHHALSDDAMGFCFVNNVAVAVERALTEEGDSADEDGDAEVVVGADAGDDGPGSGGDDAPERVAIVDWDVHHGNGTQAHFADRGDVLYVSIHARDLFPASGTAGETGTGDGEGATLNLPVPGTAGDGEFLAVYDRVVDPLLRRFDPDLVAVSAGFDAHRRDPLSRAQVSTEGFGSLAALLGATTRAVGAAGPAVVLEGGYDPDALAASVLATHDALVDRADPVCSPPATVPGTVASLVEGQRRRFDL